MFGHFYTGPALLFDPEERPIASSVEQTRRFDVGEVFRGFAEKKLPEKAFYFETVSQSICQKTNSNNQFLFHRWSVKSKEMKSSGARKSLLIGLKLFNFMPRKWSVTYRNLEEQ